LDFNDSFLPRAITPYDFKLVRTLFVVSVYRLYRSKKKVEVKLALSIYHQRPQAPSGSGPTAYENLAAARRWRRSSGGAAVAAAVAAAMRRQCGGSKQQVRDSVREKLKVACSASQDTLCYVTTSLPKMVDGTD
jgi:hypothetical protein